MPALGVPKEEDATYKGQLRTLGISAEILIQRNDGEAHDTQRD
jgi:uncharacterized protein (DUF736 family)